MSRIVTLTFSPCIDKSTAVAALIPEKKLSCAPPIFEPGGGGINVARAVRKLGGDATAIYPAGGYTGHLFNELLQKEGVPSVVVPAQAPTRENLVVLDQSTNLQYRFGMPGTPLEPSEWMRCLEEVDRQPSVEYLVVSGSLPPGVPLDVFARLRQWAQQRQVRLLVDTSGPALLEAARVGAYLLKPNLAELATLAGQPELPPESVGEAAQQLVQAGTCQVLVISMGAAGAMLVTADARHHVTPPLVKRVSTVGAGDSMMAGLVLALLANRPMQEVLQYGVACGTAATLNPATGLCRAEEVNRLLDRIQSGASS